MLPVLGALDDRYRDEPVVVASVHTNKFSAEAESERIGAAMRRYDISHPVLVDRDRKVWESYGVRAWPTLVFLRPDGTIATALAGEQRRETLEPIVDELLNEARTIGALTSKHTVAGADPSPSGTLQFPSQVLATPEGLAVADSGHHRIVLANGRGEWARAIGTGAPGLEDGPGDRAQFRRPHGLALSGSTLYVADTGNHAVRAIDLDSFEVQTIAGTGHLGRDVPQDLTDARTVSLRSPWGLAIEGGVLFVSMAGAHQIWAYVPEDRAIAVFAGSGREAIDDGPLHVATFAQPTGLARSDGALFVADSETSAVRRIDLATARVTTLVGTGLFDFGDADGPHREALLQHVQDVATGPHGLLVADTYNDKIKQLDERDVATWYEGEGDLRLSEPGGLTQLDGGQVVVADTNAHRLIVIDGSTRSAKAVPLHEPGSERSRS